MQTEVAHAALIIFSRYPFSVDQEVPETDWEVYLRETANAIISQQSPQRYEMKSIRKMVFHSPVKNRFNLHLSLCQVAGGSSKAVRTVDSLHPPGDYLEGNVFDASSPVTVVETPSFHCEMTLHFPCSVV